MTEERNDIDIRLMDYFLCSDVSQSGAEPEVN